MCSLTMQYCCKICQSCFLALQCMCWLLGQNVGGVLVAGIISPFSREAKGAVLGRYLAEGVVRWLVFANFHVSKVSVYLVRRFEFQRCSTLRSNIQQSVNLIIGFLKCNCMNSCYLQ